LIAAPACDIPALASYKAGVVMSQNIKLALALGGALTVGLVVGLVLGMSGKRQALRELEKVTRRATDAEEAQRREASECSKQVSAAKSGRDVLLAKEHLLRALTELYANNFGLTSQHLAQARTRLKSAEKGLKKSELEKVKDLFDRIGGAQTLAMRLDPMARVQIEQILDELQKLPGAT
jgi:hypothetical protein